MRIIRIKIVEGSQTEQTLSLNLLWTFCVHSLAFGFHSYPIYTTKRLHAQRNTTIRSRRLSSFKVESQSNDFSYFLTGERNLESLAEDCFSARPVDEQDDLEDNYGSDFYSSDESDQEIDSDVDLDFSECDSSERSKVQAFVTKTCGCAHGYKEVNAALLFKLRISLIAETTVRNFPQLN